MWGSSAFSRTFAMGDRSDIGLYEEPSLGDLFGFGIGMMFANFQIWGILFWESTRL